MKILQVPLEASRNGSAFVRYVRITDVEILSTC